MQRKTKIIIAVIVLVLLLAGVAGYWYYGGDTAQLKNDLNIGFQEPDQTTIDIVELPEGIAPVQPSNFGPEVLARLFTERFGTFTNIDNFEGIDIVQGYMTPSFENWFNTGYKQQLQERYPESGYAGETVKVLDVTIDERTENSASAIVRTQRVVTVNNEQRTNYQILHLEMIKTGDSWLVDSAYWGDSI